VAQDHFAILGLAPGRYSPDEIRTHFRRRRAALLARLDRGAEYAQVRDELERLYVARRRLGDPERQAEYLAADGSSADDLAEFRREIAAALEDGLLRHSRREAALERGLQLGLSRFQVLLIIAQVQFGGPELDVLHVKSGPGRARNRAPAARLAATGVLALAAFLAMVRWLGQ
jgi:hypothetical protein